MNLFDNKQIFVRVKRSKSMKDVNYRIEYDEFEKDTKQIFSKLPTSSIEIVLENAKFLGKPDVVWIHQNRLESVMITEAKNYIHVHVYREDGKGVMSYIVIDPKWNNHIKKYEGHRTFKENRKAILERIEKIRDEAEMLDRALNQKTASCYIREGERLVCEICGKAILPGAVAYFLLGDGLHIDGIFCDECENDRTE